MAGEKTEKATPKRKSDERKKGNVFSSKEVVTGLSLIIVFNFIKYYSDFVLGTIIELITIFIRDIVGMENYIETSLNVVYFQGIKAIAICVLPILFIAGLTSVISTGSQTRFLFTASLLKPKFERINPLKGLKKMFSLRAVVELLKSLVKISILIYVVYSTLLGVFPKIPSMLDFTPLEAAAFIGDTILKIVVNIFYIFIAIAAVDYFYQWYEYEKNLRMSKQDIKEEYKQMEGDPQIKGKIKERQRAMSQRRMMQDVPNADVIIRNPTHYAIALKYETGKDKAPLLLAKGKDLIALRIVEIAKEHDIITTENVPLARALYESVEIGREIPEKFYAQVAEVLAWVYGLKKKKKGK